MGAAIVFSVITTIVLTISFLWVTNKAYSKKWENDSDETRHEF